MKSNNKNTYDISQAHIHSLLLKFGLWNSYNAPLSPASKTYAHGGTGLGGHESLRSAVSY